MVAVPAVLHASLLQAIPLSGAVVLKLAPSTNCLPEGGKIQFPGLVDDNVATVEVRACVCYLSTSAHPGSQIDKVGKVSIRPSVAAAGGADAKPMITFSGAFYGWLLRRSLYSSGWAVMYSIKNGTVAMLDPVGCQRLPASSAASSAHFKCACTQKSSWAKPLETDQDRSPYITQVALLSSANALPNLVGGRLHRCAC